MTEKGAKTVEKEQQITLQGIGAAPGVSVGPAVIVDRVEVVVPDLPEPAEAFRSATQVVAQELSGLADDARSRDREEAALVLEAQALMAEDPMLTSAVEDKLGQSLGLGQAINEAGAELSAMLASLDDPYLAARAADVTEVVDRVACHLAGVPPRRLDGGEPAIFVASALTAAETAQMDPDLVLGFVTETGGPTSHVVIIARSMGVPAVVGTGDIGPADADADGSDSPPAFGGLQTGETVALDGATGEVIFRPDTDAVSDFNDRAEKHRAAVAAAARWKGQQATFGTSPISVAANVANEADLERAIEEQADGIGLLRTEFLFLDRPTPPTEDEQYDFYSRAAEAVDGPVVVRTIDIGGDKPADYLTLPGEENPFLGVRGARLYHHHPEVFETQIRAILRAAAHGDIWIMVPMVTTVAEVIDIRAWVDRIAEQVAAEKGGDQPVPPFGAMVEVPALALTVDAVVEHLDFLSIGSNDLTQYTLAADRTNEALGHLQDAVHPSVLALCNLVAVGARAAGVSVSVCGLSAADPVAASAYAAMGIDKLSVSAAMVNQIKSAVSALDPGPGSEVVDQAIRCPSAADARVVIDRWRLTE